MTRTLLAAGVLALALAAPAAAADHDMSTMGQSGPAYDSRGLGPVHHAVTTRSPEAQRLFDQGLALCFAFNHDEAVRSFTRAAQADSTLAMAWWGMAYALGPNINLPVDSARSVQAYAAVQRAQALAAGASSAEQDYIAAMAKRYAATPPADRSSLDAAFRVAMRDVMQAHPDDPDAAAIYAESIMDLTPWNYWGRDGKPLRPDTDELVAVLEGLLAKHPDHPAANHYYIHAVEGSAHPERALAAAARLRTLAPDAGHLVHMPSHVMDRVGDYWEAAELNVKAAGVDSAYVARQHVEGIYPLMYWTHNRDFAASAFTRCGRYADALRYARTVRRTAEEAAPAMTMAEGFGDRPLFVQVVFHRWPEVLATPRPDSILVVTRLIWEWAQGTACAATGRLPGARAHLDALARGAAAVPGDYPVGTNTAPRVLAVAQAMLRGAIARGARDLPAAAQAYLGAVAAYDSLAYDEPEDWWAPPRLELGAVLLARHDWAGAEGVFRDELRVHAKSGRALYGLARALGGGGKKAEAQRVLADQRAAWRHADRALTAADF